MWTSRPDACRYLQIPSRRFAAIDFAGKHAAHPQQELTFSMLVEVRFLAAFHPVGLVGCRSTMKHDKKILICGAGIAGPACAWWLVKYGFSVVIVERARSFRDGGQNVDVKGAGQKVIDLMGLTTQKPNASGRARKIDEDFALPRYSDRPLQASQTRT
jgi:hypothetical protein